MSDKTYPVLYVTDLRGAIFKHCSVHPTLYFEIIKDEELMRNDPDYLPYIEKIQEECLTNIVNKFTFSQALKITNNRIAFIIFRSNIDMGMVKQFCQVLLNEVAYFTGKKHDANYMVTKSMLMQINKKPSFTKTNKVGPKLSETDFMKECGTILEGTNEPADSGWLTPYDSFKEKEKDEEEVVTWG
ncbi:Uncharacterised protein [Faecalicoccus pleomorphus]|mgnify:FL=1|uniref:Uncharacterized protein n=1 Tax=Faecalicoccus pleomorphus TaxID=1323 RepID=A0A380LL49_9FIRM|nr:hypothetical protein [Faecalicoccus pleomorphus]SUO03280.1 Uncharacterised protein [Faecalicoccus pleomorphus]